MYEVKLQSALEHISEAIADTRQYRFDRNKYNNIARLSENSFFMDNFTPEQIFSMKKAQADYNNSEAHRQEWRTDEIIKLLERARRHIKELYNYV